MILADLWVGVFQLRKCRWVTGDDRDFMLGTACPVFHLVLLGFEAKVIGAWIDHPLLFSAEIKNMWSIISTISYFLRAHI